MRSGRRGSGLALAVAVLTLPGCVSHPVGPARTDGAFEGKSTTTLAGALSTTRTAALMAKGVDEGKAWGAYACTVLSEAEDSLGGVRGTFASIQSPSGKADARRSEVLAALDVAFLDLGAARTACRRGDRPGVTTAGRALTKDADLLAALGGEKLATPQ